MANSFECRMKRIYSNDCVASECRDSISLEQIEDAHKDILRAIGECLSFLYGCDSWPVSAKVWSMLQALRDYEPMVAVVSRLNDEWDGTSDFDKCVTIEVNLHKLITEGIGGLSVEERKQLLRDWIETENVSIREVGQPEQGDDHESVGTSSEDDQEHGGGESKG